MHMKKIGYFIIFGIFLLAGDVYAGQYSKALGHVRHKDYDFAFLEFRAVINDNPSARHAKESLFGIGEYYFLQNMNEESADTFQEYIQSNPDSKASIFARAYLLKMLEEETDAKQNEEAVNEIKNGLFSKPLFLLFSDYKEINYKSPLGYKFKARYYMNSLQIYKDAKPFIKVNQ